MRDMLTRERNYTMDVKVTSAGLIGKKLSHWFQSNNISLPVPLFNQPPSQEAQTVLLRKGIDISQYRSRPVNRAILESSDLIIPLVSVLKDEVILLSPKIKGRVFLPKELLGGNLSFFWDDPFVAPFDEHYLDFVHENMSYVSSIINEIDKFLQQAYPKILSNLQDKE